MRRLLLTLCVLLGLVAQVSAAPVQTKTKSDDGGGPGVATTTVSFTSLPSVNNTIIVQVAVWNDPQPTSVSVTDNQTGNTYTKDFDQNDPTAGTSGGRVATFHALVNGSTGTFTMTISSSSGSGNFFEVVASEWAGVATSTPTCATPTAHQIAGGSTSDTLTMSGANSQASCLVMAAIMLDVTSVNVHVTVPTTGYTELYAEQNANLTIGFEAAYKQVSSVETSAATWSFDSARGASGVATYKISGGGATTGPARLLLLGVGGFLLL